jgi:hypothetical protein
MDESIEKRVADFLFEYEHAFCSLDIERMKESYAPSFVISSRAYASAVANDFAFRNILMQAAAFYESIGMVAARISACGIIPVDENHAVANVEWTLSCGDGRELVRFDVAYCIRCVERSEFICILSQNEEERIREKGFLANSR